MKRLSVFKIKVIVTSLLAAFLAQEILMYKFISEPYPALRMPPFYGNAMNSEGVYERTSVDIEIAFARGIILNISPRNFFYDAPSSHHWALLQNFTPPDTPKKSNRPIEQYTYLENILPGLIVSRNRTTRQFQDNPETLKWLRKQIKEVAPEDNPAKISFYWYRDQYNPDSLLTRHRKLTGTTTIHL